MPDRENVIKELEDYEPYAKVFTSLTVKGQVILDALALLKEQEPLAVYESKVNKCVCGNEINRYWHPEYCGFCGKKVKWND